MKTAYLTIDDGPSSDMSAKVAFLTQRRIPAVWFCIGEAMLLRPEPVLEAIKAGFVIGNHSFSHPRFSNLALPQVWREIRATDLVIDALYLRADRPRTHRFFRFPYGDKGDGRHGQVFRPVSRKGRQRAGEIQQQLRQLGYGQPAFPAVAYPFMHRHNLLTDADWQWTFDPMEWVLTGTKPMLGIRTASDVIARLTQSNPPDCRGPLLPTDARGLPGEGSDEIILIHDHARTTPLFYETLTAMTALPIRFGSVW